MILRKITYLQLAILLLFVTTALSAYSKDSRKVVKVGYFLSSKYQEGCGDDSIKRGYAYEYISNISYFTKWRYEYVYGDWPTLYKKLVNGDIDLMTGITYSKETAEEVALPEEPMRTNNYYIYAHNNDTTISMLHVETLEGKRISVVRKSTIAGILAQWAKEHKISIKIVEYNDFSSSYKAFAEHETDCILAYDSDNSIVKNVRPVARIANIAYYMAFTKKRPDLLADYNSALSKITEIEPYFTQHLQSTYYGNNIICTALSLVEKQWLDKHREIKIGYLNDYLPYSSTLSSGHVTGIVTNVTNGILQNLNIANGHTVNYSGFDNYDDMINALKEGKVDAAFPVGGNSWSAEQDGIFVSTPVVSSSMTLVFRYQINDKTTKKIAVNRNNRMQLNYTKRQYPDAEIFYCNSIEECLSAVSNGEAFSTVVNGIRINSLLANSQYTGLSFVTLTENDKRCYGVNADNDSILILLDRGLKLIGPDFGENASREYIKVDYSVMDFIREYVSVIFAGVILVVIIIISIILYIHSKTKHFLEIVSERNKELLKAQQATEYANSAKTQFLSNMSHDIRTPMNAIIGFTNLAKSHIEEREKVLGYLQKINVSSNHLLSLINEILDMSRIESGKIQFNENETSLSEQFKKIQIITEEGARQKDISIDLSFENVKNDYVITDNLRLRQIIINIIGNAIKYTNRGGWVKVCVAQTDVNSDGRAEYKFSVKDNGIGMSDEYVQHVFEPFTREHSSTVSKIQGTGLGMAITKNLVDMMGGKIEVHSKCGEGSEFIVTLTLPVVEKKIQEETVAQENISFSGKRLLLVEDNELNQEIATSILEEIGFTVDIAENGCLALQAIESKDAGYYSVVLMDIQMPVMDGYEATSRIRHLVDVEKSKVPIVAMTANAFDEDKQKAFAVGMNGHLAKPIDPARIIEELTKVIA